MHDSCSHDAKAAPSRGFRSHALALVGFIVITVVMTYPTVFRMGSTVSDGRDPVFNAWVIAWNAHSLLTGNLGGVFDTNIFYPAANTAAQSEFLIPQSMIAAPVLWASDNPILAYNFVLLVAFATSAFGAYLLGSYFTGPAGGFIAGLVFAFNPFMMNQLSHVQILSAGGIPLAFLYLHRFFTEGRTRDLLLFSTFYVAQALANTYYALYLTAFAGLYIVAHVVYRRRYLDMRLWAGMALHSIISLAVLTPFFSRYIALRRDFGMMVRSDESVATALSFVSTSPNNRLYGTATEAFFQNEATLFPGLCALVLVAVGIWGGWVLRRRRLDHTGPRFVALAYRITTWGLVVSGALVVEILGSGGIDTTIGPIPIRASSLRNTLALCVVLVVARIVLKRRFGVTSSVSGNWDTRLVYVCMLGAALVLTLPTGASALIHGHVPGFEGIRGVTRIHVMSMLAVSILAAYGLAAIVRRLGPRGRAVAAVLALLIGLEYLSIPVSGVAIPSKQDAPEVYRWLASDDEDFAFVEYPIDRSLQTWQVFFSTYHWKRLVTGASGFASKTYIELVQRKELVPSPTTLEDFERIGVRYLIVHDRPSEDGSANLLPSLGPSLDRLRLVETFASYDVLKESDGGRRMIVGGRARVYELTRSEWRPPRLVRKFSGREGAEVLSTGREQWAMTGSANPDLLPHAVDGRLSTRWHALQRPGQYFQLDLGRELALNGVVMDISHQYARGAPRGYQVELSRDGETWSSVADNPAYAIPLTEFLRPRMFRVDIGFEETLARYVRVTQTGADPDYRWSVSELYVTVPR